VIDVHFIFLGAAIGAVGQSIYIRDTVRGVTQPNRVSFLLWAAAPLLAFAVEINQGVGLTSLMTFMVGAGPLAIFAASFVNRNAVWRIGRLEYVCAAVSVLGTLGWLVSRHGVVAIVASIAADLLAGIPTISKSWAHPETETAWLYVGGFLFAVITLLTVQKATLAAVAFPAYIAAMGMLQITLVAGRVGVRHRWRGQPASHKMGP
jgi:hypothetical protein